MKPRLLAIGTLATALSLTPLAAHAASNSGSSSSGSTTATTTATTTVTTTPSATPTTAAKTTSSPSTTTATGTRTGKYEVLSGTFTTAARANKHLKALEAAGIHGLSVKVLGTTKKRYLVEERGLTRAQAKAKVKALHAAKFTALYFQR